MNPKKLSNSISFFVVGGVMAYIRPLANGNFRADVRTKGIVKNKILAVIGGLTKKPHQAYHELLFIRLGVASLMKSPKQIRGG